MEAVAGTIPSEINRKLIPELVDLNFDGVENYPTIDFEGISDADVAGLAEAYSKLTTAGGMKPTKGDEPFFRAMMGLPPLTQDDIDEREKKEEEMKQNMPDPANPNADPNADTKDMPNDKPPKDEKKVDDATKKKRMSTPGVTRSMIVLRVGDH